MPGSTRPAPHLEAPAAPAEGRALVAAPQPASVAWLPHVATFCLFAGLYTVCSSGLIAFNKYLIHPERFPFAVPLVLLHTIFCSVLTGVLLLLFPSLFPSLTSPDKQTRTTLDWRLFVKGTVPVAALFTCQLVLTNTAYLHSTVAFIQMMKESNLVVVYALSLLAALERFSWMQVRVLLFVVAATCLTIHGEINFSYKGFVIQGLGQMFECCRIVLQAVLLTSAGRKLDALTYVLLVMPWCAMFLLAGWFSLAFVYPSTFFAIPHMHDLYTWWPYLLVNSLLAFALNVVVALFIKHSQAVSFILVGILKDAMIVMMGAVFLREVITFLQLIGFSLQILGILIWSILKTFPSEFEGGIASGFLVLLRKKYEENIAGKGITGVPPYGATSRSNQA